MLLLLAALAATTAGCRDEYAHERLDGRSPRFVKVAEMLASLRAAGESGFDAACDEQTAEGLDKNRRLAVRLTLRQLSDAKKVELLRVDRFGENMYRATIGYAWQGEKRTIALLLFADGEDNLRWAGRN